MDDRCIFCGRTISLWDGGDTMLCGGVRQPVCGSCWDRYSDLPALQRAKQALETGRAREPEKLSAFLSKAAERQKELEARKRARQALIRSVKEGQSDRTRCCGFEMVQEGPYTFSDQTPFTFRMLPVYTPALLLFRCEVCGQVRFFDAGIFSDEEELPEPETEPEEQIACPDCGTRHSSLIGCPTCALRSAQSGQRPKPSKSREEPKPSKPARSRFGKKPPWEK